MVEVRPEKIALLEKDAWMYYRKNEEKFEQASKYLTEKRSIPRQMYDVVNDYMRY
jgi:hypothetical protein